MMSEQLPPDQIMINGQVVNKPKPDLDVKVPNEVNETQLLMVIICALVTLVLMTSCTTLIVGIVTLVVVGHPEMIK